MKRNAIIVLVAVIVLVALALVPLVTKNHIYTGIIADNQAHSDFRTFVGKISDYAEGKPVVVLYPAEIIIGKSLAVVGGVTRIDYKILYIVFIFLSLIIAGFVIYKVGSGIFGGKAGWFALLVTMLCTTSILGLFSYGVIANILNMYVFLLLAVYFAVKWLDGGRYCYAILSIVGFGFFSVFHVTGLYLLYMLAFAVVLLLILKIVKKGVSIRKPLVLIVVLATLGIIATIYTFDFSWAKAPLNNIILMITQAGISQMQLQYTPLSAGNYFANFLGWITSALAVITGVFAFISRSSIKFINREKYLLLILGCMLIPLYVGTFTVLSPDSVRAALDCSSLSAFTIALLFSKVSQVKNDVLELGGYALIGVGSLITLVSWIK